MSDMEFRERRRQHFLRQESFKATIKQILAEKEELNEELQRPNYLTEEGVRGTYDMLASRELRMFQLRFTAGEDLTVLAHSLTGVVEAYEWTRPCISGPSVLVI